MDTLGSGGVWTGVVLAGLISIIVDVEGASGGNKSAFDFVVEVGSWGIVAMSDVAGSVGGDDQR